MKRWLGISLWAVAGLTGFAIITFAVFVWLLLVPSRTYQRIGGRFLRKAVAEDITDFQYLGPLCQ